MGNSHSVATAAKSHMRVLNALLVTTNVIAAIDLDIGRMPASQNRNKKTNPRKQYIKSAKVKAATKKVFFWAHSAKMS